MAANTQKIEEEANAPSPHLQLAKGCSVAGELILRFCCACHVVLDASAAAGGAWWRPGMIISTRLASME